MSHSCCIQNKKIFFSPDSSKINKILSWILLICLMITIAHAQYWTLTSNLTYARVYHTATLLPNGNVLVAGGQNNTVALNSAELYNAVTGLWTVTGSLAYARWFHTATLLPNGNVLVAAGNIGSNALNSAELYSAVTGVWTVTGSLTYARWFHTATLLPNGNVLVAAGNGDDNSAYLNSAELYNVTTGLWTVTGSLTYARFRHTATLLPNGNVLVAGGYSSIADLSSTELYNATTGVWTVTGNLTYARDYHTATLLNNGNVLVAAGYGYDNVYGYINNADLYNASTGVWTVTGSLTYARDAHTATLLPNGNVLVAGGWDGNNALNSAEVYNATTGVWTVTSSLTYARDFHTATLLPNGNLLVAAGCDVPPSGSCDGYYSAEVYIPQFLTITPTTTLTPTSSSTGSTGSTNTKPSPSVNASSSPNAGAIVGGVIGGLVGLVLAALLLWFLRSRFQNKKDDLNALLESENRDSFTPMTNTFLSNQQSENIYIPFDAIKLGDILGQGHFGQVYQADYTGTQVAVKKSKGIDEKLILEEAIMMKNIPPHPNVLQYYGVSQENGEFAMVTELCDKNNLAKYLRNANNKPTLQELRRFCRQIACGMWHISKHSIIHRDLRAENILLSGKTKLVAKVADFGLARSLKNKNDESDSLYYRMSEMKEIPIAWTAPEVLNPADQFKYVAASDVWSFGILMWEVYSFGAKPFDGMSVQLTAATIREQNRRGALLPRPKNCPKDIFNIMQSCWAFNPQDRPTFEQLYNQLA